MIKLSKPKSYKVSDKAQSDFYSKMVFYLNNTTPHNLNTIYDVRNFWSRVTPDKWGDVVSISNAIASMEFIEEWGISFYRWQWMRYCEWQAIQDKVEHYKEVDELYAHKYNAYLTQEDAKRNPDAIINYANQFWSYNGGLNQVYIGMFDMENCFIIDTRYDYVKMEVIYIGIVFVPVNTLIQDLLPDGVYLQAETFERFFNLNDYPESCKLYYPTLDIDNGRIAITLDLRGKDGGFRGETRLYLEQDYPYDEWVIRPNSSTGLAYSVENLKWHADSLEKVYKWLEKLTQTDGFEQLMKR